MPDVPVRQEPPVTGGAAPLQELAVAAADCRACALYRRASQVVFGEGPDDARLVLVGEQPGDVEDRHGRPFVGPAGQLLDRALGDAGIERSATYLTNVVKHFKWVPRGKRRLHQTPDATEVQACRPWLDQELAVLRPELVVALGATAARELLGAGIRVTRDRGTFHVVEGVGRVMPTIHPSAVLRLGEPARQTAYQALVDDLALAGARLGAG